MTEVKKIGFAALDAVKRQSMSSLGGKTAHANGTAHKYTSESASLASAKGVAVRRENAARRAALKAQNTAVQS